MVSIVSEGPKSEEENKFIRIERIEFSTKNKVLIYKSYKHFIKSQSKELALLLFPHYYITLTSRNREIIFTYHICPSIHSTQSIFNFHNISLAIHLGRHNSSKNEVGLSCGIWAIHDVTKLGRETTIFETDGSCLWYTFPIIGLKYPSSWFEGILRRLLTSRGFGTTFTFCYIGSLCCSCHTLITKCLFDGVAWSCNTLDFNIATNWSIFHSTHDRIVGDSTYGSCYLQWEKKEKTEWEKKSKNLFHIKKLGSSDSMTWLYGKGDKKET